MRPQVDPARVPSPQSGIPGLPIGHLLNEKTDDDFAARLEAVRAEAFAQGRKVGEAEAAAKNFERGLAIGKEQGLSEGRTNAVEANRLATELAVNEAVADTELITRLKTVDEVRQAERLRDMTDSNLPVYFLGTVLVCLMFFILARMDRGRSRNADVQAEHYREFINQIFDVAADFLRRDADRSGTPRNLPPPVNSGDDRFKLGEGR